MSPVLVLVGLGLFVLACSAPRKRPSDSEPPDSEPPPDPVPPLLPRSEPLDITLKVGADQLNERQIETVLDAIDTWNQALSGQIVLRPVLTDTACEEPHAIFFVERGECRLPCIPDDAGRLRCAGGHSNGLDWSLTVRKDLPLDVFYFVLVHEMGHSLGLGESDGFMSPTTSDPTQTTVTAAHLDTIAETYQLDRSKLPRDGLSFEYLSAARRLAGERATE